MNFIDKSYAIEEFETMRSQYQRALYQLVTPTGKSESPKSILASSPTAGLRPSSLEWSQYHREFEELHLIASGGFGSVFKARHRLDGIAYAVKKIYIKSSDVVSSMKHLTEVKIFASLNHPNIVNYKAAWLEPMIGATEQINDELSNLSSYISEVLSTDHLGKFKTHNSEDLNRQQSQSDSDSIISFRNSNSQEQENNSMEYFDESESEKNPNSQRENVICTLFDNKGMTEGKHQWATLFIQMTLCTETLTQFLDRRNKDKLRYDSALELEINMFTQLAKALAYLHRLGIMHYDVKPSNVFVTLSEDGVVVQLGDFGLACWQHQSNSGLAVGTRLYAAPEQLIGKCHRKSDMYSLGIILLQLVQPFGTQMELVTTIKEILEGQMPAHLINNHPKLAHIIGKLVHRRPGGRLDSTELLEELEALAENKDEIITLLRNEVAAKDDEIAQLKMRLR